MKFLTLVEIEIKKILPWLATLFISLTALSTLLFYRSISNFKTNMLPQIINTSVTEYVEEYGKLSLNHVFDQTVSLPLSYIFFALLLICVTFYLWYKEWFGTSKTYLFASFLKRTSLFYLVIQTSCHLRFFFHLLRCYFIKSRNRCLTHEIYSS